ncbi:MAG TPA: DUF6585 family protein [Ktedonosporobacter sp.]|nr:DUF6585 family protein [Ktedonosporobacter sp.]
MAKNLATQGVLPLPMPVQQAAAARGLGAFRKTYQATLARTVAVIILFLLAAVGFSAGAIFGNDLNIGGRIIFLLLVLLFVVVSIYLIFSVIEAAQRQLYLFQLGLVIEKGNQIQVLPWRDLQVRQSITRRSSNGIYVGTTYSYTLRRSDGYHIELGSLVKNIAELGQAITTGVTQELVPHAFSAIRAGQTLTFDPFSVNLQGIGFKREFLPWPQVQEVVASRGSLTIKKAPPRSGSWLALVSRVPNVMVFLVIAEEMRKQAA